MAPKGIRYQDRPAHYKSLYQLKYPGQQSGHDKIKYVLLTLISNHKELHVE
jgi:hypothetical protein